jgi:hypothetical protein
VEKAVSWIIPAPGGSSKLEFARDSYTNTGDILGVPGEGLIRTPFGSGGVPLF